MKITIMGRKCSPRESFKEHAEKKLAKVERFFGSSAEAKVVATVEKSSQTVEITIVNQGMIFRAQERAELRRSFAAEPLTTFFLRQSLLSLKRKLRLSEAKSLPSNRRASMRPFFR